MYKHYFHLKISDYMKNTFAQKFRLVAVVGNLFGPPGDNHKLKRVCGPNKNTSLIL